MAASIQQSFEPHPGFVPVGDDTVAVTFDLERGEMVLIVPVATTTTARSWGMIFCWALVIAPLIVGLTSPALGLVR